MISEYELIVLVKPTSEKIAQETYSSVKKLLASKGTKIKKESEWGKKALAYPIQKQSEAFYYLWDFSLDGKEIGGLGEKIKNSEGVLRHLLVKVQEKAMKKEKVKSATKKAEKKG